MTIQEKRDALLIYLVEATKSTPGASMGSSILLDADDAKEAISRSELANQSELAFFVKSLGDQGLLIPRSTLSSIGFAITMAGYEYAESLGSHP